MSDDCSWNHPDVRYFEDVMWRARELYPEYERAALEYARVVHKLKALAYEAACLRRALVQTGEERRVDSLGWPGMNHRGELVTEGVRIVPLRHGGPAYRS